jgi:fructose-bisphosphate aldolase class II
MLYPQHSYEMHWTNLEGFAAMVRAEAEKVEVPIGLHLDHCTDFEFMMAAIKAGFPSVMYDGSMLSVEENIRNTREVARAAHALGAEVEAELGRVGFANTITDQSNLDMYTKPEVAKAFCEQSTCDSVAVAIGSAHGFYKETPKLDLDRLSEINAATDIPLVLHGGSGIPADQLEIAFTRGINKFNVGTEFLWLYKETIIKFTGVDIATMANEAQDALRAYLRKKMQLTRM